MNKVTFSSSCSSPNISMRNLTFEEVISEIYEHGAVTKAEVSHRMTTEAFGTSRSSTDLVAISKLHTPLAKFWNISCFFESQIKREYKDNVLT